MTVKPAYKPGSVPDAFAPAAAIYLGQILLFVSSNQPGRRAGSPISSLFDLAPDVVYLASMLPNCR